MSVPLYQTTLTAVKNLLALANWRGLTPTRKTNEDLSAQVVRDLMNRSGAHDTLPTVVTTAGAATYTSAAFQSGLIKRDPSGSNRTDVTPTAEEIITALLLANDYDEGYVTLYNNADAAETITLNGGTGVTLQGTITCSRDCVIRLRFTRTSSTTVACTSC